MEKSLTVKSTFGIDIKRFDIPAGSTFSDLKTTLLQLYKKEDVSIRYRDEDGDMIALTTEEEFTEALKSVPKTGDILRLYLEDKKGKIEAAKKAIKKQNLKSIEKSKVTKKDNNKSADSQNIKDDENSKNIDGDYKLDNAEKGISSPSTGAQRKMNTYPRLKWRKIESASKLSKDLNFNNSEVTGREPVKPQNTEEASHLSSQKPGYRKARRLSSSNNEKNGKIANRGRPDKRQHKRKRNCTSSSSSSSDRSSSGSSSVSSESSSEDETNVTEYKSKNVALNKKFCEFEKKMLDKVNKSINDSKEEIKKELTPQIIQDMLLRLDGAVIQSIPQGYIPASVDTSAIPKDGERARYHHQNVICDVCQNEIFGPRYKCGNCSDYDLCEECEKIEGIHTPSHVFLKINYPSVHCGRRSISGKARPLLSTNIYEEREKEREREELLQRKLDSGSELSVKKVEKMEKQRLKRKEAERTRENKEARREEWRNLKRELKELKKRKKELKKKVKKHVKVYKTEKRVENVADEIPCESTITKTNDTMSLQDESLSQALSQLKFVNDCCDVTNAEFPPNVEETSDTVELPKSESLVFVEPLENPTIDDGNLSDSSDKTDSEVIVVSRDSQQPMDVINDQLVNNDLSKKPDLVDFDTDVAESIASEDFIVVSKYLDLSVPLDENAIIEHQRFHESNGTTCSDTCLNDAVSFPYCVENEQQLPVDLVASVPEPRSRVQPDIALSTAPTPPSEVSMVRDDDIAFSPRNENVVTVTSTSGEHEHTEENDNVQISFTSSNVADDNGTVTTTTSVTVVSKQPEPCDVISTQPTLHDEILSLKQNVDVIDIQPSTAADKPLTLLQQAEVLHQGETSNANIDEVASQVDASDEVVVTEVSKFNPPSPKFVKDLNSQREKESMTTPQSTSSTTTTTTTTEEAVVVTTRLPSITGVITEVIGSVVDVAASAASAIGVTSNTTPTPQAHYTNSTVTFDWKEEEMKMQHLQDMGFFDRHLNQNLLRKYKNDINKCVEELLKATNADWHQTRH